MEQHHFSGENRLFDKQKALKRAFEEVEKLTDKLGTPIDPGIKETVALLRAMDFPTDSSCAGHTNEDGKGYGTPHVRIYSPAPKGWWEDRYNQQLREQWRQENLKHRARFQPLLEEYNKSRNVSEDIRLRMRDIGRFGAYTLENGKTHKFNTDEDIIAQIKAFQNEMKAFTEFLKKKYFEQPDS